MRAVGKTPGQWRCDSCRSESPVGDVKFDSQLRCTFCGEPPLQVLDWLCRCCNAVNGRYKSHCHRCKAHREAPVARLKGYLSVIAILLAAFIVLAVVGGGLEALAIHGGSCDDAMDCGWRGR